jgi:hypothetical protein
MLMNTKPKEQNRGSNPPGKGGQSMEEIYYSYDLERTFTRQQLEDERKRYLEDGDTYATENLEDFIRNALYDGGLERVRIVNRISYRGKAVYTESNIKTDLY